MRYLFFTLRIEKVSHCKRNGSSVLSISSNANKLIWLISLTVFRNEDGVEGGSLFENLQRQIIAVMQGKRKL